MGEKQERCGDLGMINLKVVEASNPLNMVAALEVVVNLRTGSCFGLCCKAGQPYLPESGPQQALAAEPDWQTLQKTELRFLKDLAESVTKVPGYEKLKLFIDLDDRLPIAKRDWPAMEKAADQLRARKVFDSICLVMSDSSMSDFSRELQTLHALKSHGLSIAVKAARLASPGLGLLVESSPDFLFLERSIYSKADHDPRRAKTLSSLINLAHRLGVTVAARGVDSSSSFYTCRETGCDLVHGSFVATPITDRNKLIPVYQHIKKLSHQDKRQNHGDHRFVESHMAYVEPVAAGIRPIEAMNVFKDPEHPGYVPVVNPNNEPLGLVMESNLKPFAYSRYGKYILENPTINKSIIDFTVRSPIVDIHSPIDEVLEIYVQDDSLPGVIVVDELKYVGFLDARSLLKALNEKNLAQARDQNPLTKLPGNSMINRYLSRVICQPENSFILVYFDLDNFKPYNDKYGFRRGDRVLILFSEIMKANQHRKGYFCGHIGGDDFFLGMENWGQDEAKKEVTAIVNKFAHDVLSFYSQEDREKGGIEAKDRFGSLRHFPTLTVSAAMLSFARGRTHQTTMNEIGTRIADLKKQAKESPTKVAYADA
jgi:diguanylate cyclase (GGDEF)-like protein